MKKENLLILNKTIEYSIRESKLAKRMRVAVYSDGDIIATKPSGIKLDVLKKFIESKKGWIAKKIEKEKIQITPELKENSRIHYLLHKIKARNLVKNKLEKWNKIFGFECRGIKIKKLKSRWGSCSSNKYLNINYKVMFLPELMQDYIIVHELCHLKEMNHSRKFWSLVAHAIPEYQIISKNIRKI